MDPVFVDRYKELIGWLLYLSVNTMPEIGYVMSSLTRYMTKKLGEYVNQVVRYVWGRREAKLTWCTNKVKLSLTEKKIMSSGRNVSGQFS